MAFPQNFTYNFNPNPSFIDGTQGVTSLNSASFFSDLKLNHALNVTTPGNAVNEGIQLPPGQMLDSVTGAVSLQIQGTGTLNVSAVDTTTSTVLDTLQVILDPVLPWQNIALTGLSLVNGDNLSVIIETPSIQQAQFWVTKVQYEPVTSANAGALPTPYCDGDQADCFWTGATELSASYKPFEFMISGTGLISAPGNAQFLASGEIVFLVNANPSIGPTTVYGGVDCSGIPFQGMETNTPGFPGGTPFFIEGFGNVVQAGVTEVSLPSGLSDFAIWSAAKDIDPAIITVGFNNAGTNSGTDTSGSAGWQRIYGRYSIPLRQISNAGFYTWNSGVYFGIGFDFTSIAAHDGVNVAYAQAEISRNLDTGPSAYQRPRALVPVVGPTNGNMVTNPAFESDITGWSGFGGNWASSIELDPVNVYNGQNNSLLVTGLGSGLGTYIVVPDLIVGQEYTLSGYVWPNSSNPATSGIYDIQAVVSPLVAGSSLSFAAAGSSLKIASTLNTPLPGWTSGQKIWYRPSVTFRATKSNMIVGFYATGITGDNATSMSFDLAETMVDLGGTLTAYGDGNSDDWAWEGTAGLSRSYYYERVQIASQFIGDILAQHIPLGQFFYDAEYFVPMSQVSSLW
jgi:hypothetical protein